jgi:hypothetical protein
MKYYEYETKNCIVCGKEAKVWSGHVHYKHNLKDSIDPTYKDMVAAGFCDDHEKVPQKGFISGREGLEGLEDCFGKWKKQDGLNKIEIE